MASILDTNSNSSAWQRLGQGLPWLVLAVFLFITMQLWNETRQDARKDLQAIFDARVREVTRDLEQRMNVYEQVLRGTQGLFSASRSVERSEFHIYVGQQQLEQNYPGIQGLGFSLIVTHAQKERHIATMRGESTGAGRPAYDIKPEGRRASYAPVVFLEPSSELNRQSLGFDMYSDQAAQHEGELRRAAMERARDSGKAAISGKVQLTAENGQGTQPGFMMYLPVYKISSSHDTITERRAGIIGWVYASFRAVDLMANLLGEHAELLDFEIFDGGVMSTSTLMHDSDNDYGSRHEAGYQNIQHLEIAGHLWTIAIRSHPGFEALEAHHRTYWVAFFGIVASLLLALLTRLLVQGRERAMQAARKMNKDLIRSEASLHAMLDNLPHLTWLKDTKGRFVAANQSFLKTTSKQHIDEVLGKTDLDLWPRELAEKYRADDAEVMRTRKQLSVTERSIMEGGRLAWVDTFKAPIIGENGKLLGTAGIAKDITDRLESQQTIERISLLYKMLSEMNSANIHFKDRGQIFETACRIPVQSGLFRMAWIGLLDRERGSVITVAQAGHVDGYLDNLGINIFDDARGNGPVGRALKSGTYACNDIANDPLMAPWRDEALKRGYRAVITCPLKQSGQVIGAYSLYLNDAGSLTDDVIKLLNSLAEDISFTLDFILESSRREKAQYELQELSVFLQSALENERKRIARELHDELGQTMTALHFDLKWLQEHVDTRQPDVPNRLHSMQTLLGRTVDTVRRISEDLRPGMLDDLGLAAAIEHHVEKFQTQTGIACDLAMNPSEFELDDQTATALFRIVQESLTNVARHSGASRVTIHLQELGDKILLVIQDDGRGLPAPGNQTQIRKTYGLLGMRERVKMLGGTLDIFNEAGAGARIEACIAKHPTTRIPQ
jgi:PAS domain S-box-containing protein